MDEFVHQKPGNQCGQKMQFHDKKQSGPCNNIRCGFVSAGGGTTIFPIRLDEFLFVLHCPMFNNQVLEPVEEECSFPNTANITGW